MKTVMLRNVEVGCGKPKVIVPIVAATAQGILEKAREFRAHALDVVEWRVDFYEDVFQLPKVLSTLKGLREILGETPILFTFRTRKEGGEKEIDMEAYTALNTAVAQSGDADAVDVEVFSGDEVVRRNIQAIHAAGKAVVGSNHDFGGTPDKADLLFRLRKMQELGADIPKIAVMPRCPGDVIALLDATQEMSGKYADRPIITMSMGAGVVSRLCGEYFGSAMTFGAVGQVSAPGQIPVEELNAAAKKYGEPRRTSIVYPHEITSYTPEEEQKEEYPVTVFLSREGYFKKITPASLRMNSEQKFKEGDALRQSFETTSNAEVMFFTDRCQVYKTRLSEFGDSKASVLGDYLPAKLGMDESESVVYMVLPGDYSGHLLFFFENGKIARVEMKAYATVSNRRKLTGAYSDKSRLVAILPLAEDRELALLSTEPRALIFHTSLLLPKATRSTQGVAVMTLKPKYQLQRVCTPEESGIVNLPRYRARSIPGTGALLRPEDRGEEQLTLL